MNNKLEILKLARQRIQQGWVRGHFAVKVETDVNETKVLVQCGPAEPDACAWCLDGALLSATFTHATSDPDAFQRDGTEHWYRARTEVVKLLSNLIPDTEAPSSDEPEHRIHAYNDRFYREHKEVLELLDKAIAEVSK